MKGEIRCKDYLGERLLKWKVSQQRQASLTQHQLRLLLGALLSFSEPLHLPGEGSGHDHVDGDRYPQ